MEEQRELKARLLAALPHRRYGIVRDLNNLEHRVNTMLLHCLYISRDLSKHANTAALKEALQDEQQGLEMFLG